MSAGRINKSIGFCRESEIVFTFFSLAKASKSFLETFLMAAMDVAKYAICSFQMVALSRKF